MAPNVLTTTTTTTNDHGWKTLRKSEMSTVSIGTYISTMVEVKFVNNRMNRYV